MKRDKLLTEKDKVQKMLWIEAKQASSNYAALIHKKAQKIITLHSIKTAAI